MPELPEVETMVRGIRPHAAGRRIARLEICRCSRKPITLYPTRLSLVRRAAGQKIEGVSRLAKRVVLSLESGNSIVIEPRMTGLLLVSDPPSLEHRRVRWHFASGKGLSDDIVFWDRRGLGTVSLLTAAEFATLKQRLGCDALQLTEESLFEVLKATRRELKSALLDQKCISGIGNLYASEILHLAGISPFRAADSLARNRLPRLLQAIRHVLQEAIRNEGSTLGDGTYRNALNQDGTYQNHHLVYQRAGERCTRCAHGIIQRVVQAQRSTFYCPKCQT